MHAPLIDAAMVLCARAGEKGPAWALVLFVLQMCIKVKSEPRITLIFGMGCTV